MRPDCSKEISTFEDKSVRLPEEERQKMRDRRRANEDRLKKNLATDNLTPIRFIQQGSYSMWTMVQDSDCDYDIDDGVIFAKDDLVGPRGADKLPKDARQMVCDALQDSRFNRPPEVHKNCARIFYQEGYHVDMPVYRQFENFWGNTVLELASGDNWKESKPDAVTEWFNTAVINLSPEDKGSRQLRRIVRLMKSFCRSRPSWKDKMPSGLLISTLLAKMLCYKAVKDCDDDSLLRTMRALKSQLDWSKEVEHPVVSGEMLTKGPSDSKTTFFQEKLEWALEQLKDIESDDCSKEDALAAWGKVFNQTSFPPTAKKSATNGQAPALAILHEGMNHPQKAELRGGGRYA